LPGCRRLVRCIRRDAQQSLDVDVVGLWLERVPEEHQEVDSSFGNCRADLLISAQRPSEKPVNREAKLVGQQRPVVPVA